MRALILSTGAASALALLAGCSTPAPQAALPETQQQLTARGGGKISWPLTDDDRAKVNTEVQTLLAAELTVDSSVQIALLNNRKLRATFEELGLSQAALTAASRPANPSFSASVMWPHDAPRGPNVSFGLSATLMDTLLLPLRKRLAADELVQTQRRLVAEVLDLTAEVKSAAYTVMSDGEMLRRLGVIFEVNAAALDLSQRQHNAGNISDLALATMQSSAQQTRVEILRAEAAAAANREKLSRLLGLSSAQASWKFAAPLPVLPAREKLPENLVELGQQQRLDLAAARAEAELAERSLTLYRRGRIAPGLNIGVETERESDGGRKTGPNVEVELPLFDQGQIETQRLQAKLRQSRDLADALAAEIGSEIRAAHASLLATHEAASFYEQTLLPQQRRVLREELLHYNAMQHSVHELLAAKERQQRTEQDAVEALRDYWLARVELEHALGTQLP
ncbi:TolC family protein [Oleiharenicola lentus]|uniref:TolC family protein n=1 Tax=Oleiharenicola lentus TaxID=2508720 RepID=UPI003F66D113